MENFYIYYQNEGIEVIEEIKAETKEKAFKTFQSKEGYQQNKMFNINNYKKLELLDEYTHKQRIHIKYTKESEVKNKNKWIKKIEKLKTDNKPFLIKSIDLLAFIHVIENNFDFYGYLNIERTKSQKSCKVSFYYDYFEKINNIE